jgi:large subunit ribosomal protein L18
LAVFRSNRHIYAQIVDDVAGVTLASASTRAKGLRDKLSDCGNKGAAEVVGEVVAKQALGVGIKCVCFDRNRYKFHGRVKALAESARKTGLAF